MLELRYAPRWRAASVVLLLLVLGAAVMPAIWLWPDRRELASWFGQIDKVTHVLAFAFLAVWFAGQYRPRSYWRIALGLLAFGVFIEVCQRLVGYRSAEWLDVAADILGIIVGLLIAAAGLGGWCQRFEARFLT
jgi:VanZ family protein